MPIFDGEMNELEQQVMKMLLDGDDPVLVVLREQYAHASIGAKEYPGTGFRIRFNVPEVVLPLPEEPWFYFGDLNADIPPLEGGAGFLLWIADGYLDYLEGYTYGFETWPEEITEFSLVYTNGKRDLSKMRVDQERYERRKYSPIDVEEEEEEKIF